MNEQLGIGIIGGGFVGAAMARVFQHYADVRVFDVNKERATHSFNDTISQDVIFVCLPTPMQANGQVDTSYVSSALQSIAMNTVVWKPVVLKSTIPPIDLVKLAVEYQDHFALIFSPEFLTERTAEYDLQQSTRFIFGCLDTVHDSHPQDLVNYLFRERFAGVSRFWTNLETAALVKYFTNVFFATKVSLWNEFSQIAEGYGVDAKEAIGLTMLDSRIGRSHYQVPGHDGNYGFGGSCFIKDINAFIHIAKTAKVKPVISSAAWRKNVEVRGLDHLTRELQRLIGRAASEDIVRSDIIALGRDDEDY